MILYKTNQNWLGDLSHLFKSWTMVRIVRAVAAMGVYAFVVCIILEQFDMLHYISINTSIFSLLGVILSIFLVFRTNSAYDRWQEARKQWGALVNNCRNLAIYVDGMYPKKNQDIRHWMAAVPLSMFLFFALLGVELLGEEIEDPFGLDCNDLPTGDIAHTIKKNVFEILEDRKPMDTKERELYEKVF